ncbi:MAG: DDE-type integrase/transposase/recombinase [Nanoarchaeota archaeon]|nr:DDE-type integrase/transposase/recombinase [Nanoarchaeota archaeon]MBU0976848.1 DDE-type integrase/transposase/recombinase [Nanoarchaeota archaeon]
MINTQEYIKNFSEWRNERAKAILQKGEPQALDEFTYLVPSQNSDRKYKVTHIDAYSCECEDFKRRCAGKNLYCKHIKAILLFEKIKAKYEVEPQVEREIELIIDTPQKDLCPDCQSENLIKSGKRKTKIGTKQRYECRDCKKRFVLTPIKNIKGNAKLVCLAMDCYYRGLSYRDISHQFEQFYNLKISHVTIRDWVLKFGNIMEKYSEKIQPQIKGVWNADETLILTKRGKDKKNPNKNFDYVWNVMDNKTKFLLASECSGRSRSKKDAQHVFEVAHKQNGKIPYQIITDRYAGYQDGVRKAFRNWGNERKVKHTSIVGKRKIINNNAIESHHSHQKEFHKVRRGVTDVQSYQDGFKIFHNFVRKNARQNLTPADKCGIGLKGNAWETLLLNSIKYNNSRNLTGEEKNVITP